MAQWKRAGPITQRSEDQNLALLTFLFLILITCRKHYSKITLENSNEDP